MDEYKPLEGGQGAVAAANGARSAGDYGGVGVVASASQEEGSPRRSGGEAQTPPPAPGEAVQVDPFKPKLKRNLSLESNV